MGYMFATVWELVSYRHLLVSLAWRDLRVRYKQTMLGMGWAVLMPLALMLIFTFVFTRAVTVLEIKELSMPYALFAYTGLVPWTFFSASLTGCVNSLVANRNLVTKINFPREVFPLSCIGSSLADFTVAASLVVALGGYFHLSGDWTMELHRSMLMLPVVLCVQLIFTVGLGLFLAMGNLFYRDVRQLFTVGIQLWMFVTCVLYPLPTSGTLFARLVWLNPMTPIISAYRGCLLGAESLWTVHFIYAVLVACLTCAGGLICFRRSAYRFAECI